MRKLLPALFALCALLAAAAGNAAAATPPTISKVKPMTAGIGDTLTLTGKHFRKGTGKNTVVFKADGGKAVFLKAGTSSSTSMKVVLTQKLRPFLTVANGQPQPTRFRLRVLSSRFGTKFTPTRLSPLIKADPLQNTGGPGGPTGSGATPPPPPDCDADKIPDATDLDDDNDGLPDADEVTYRTDTCNKDTDSDGVQDAFEVESALDMNSHNLPYPYKRPYPNALDKADANTDFDGDGLTLTEESKLNATEGATGRTMLYSDGNQNTQPVLSSSPSWPEPAAVLQKLCVNPVGPAEQCATSVEVADYLDVTADNKLSDDERDADHDGLSNFDELHARFSKGTWWFNLAYPSGVEKGFPIAYEGTSAYDQDSDGDGVIDGADDQDDDGFPNSYEISRRIANIGFDPSADDYNPIGQVNPFNPCLPVSERENHCPVYVVDGKDYQVATPTYAIMAGRQG